MTKKKELSELDVSEIVQKLKKDRTVGGGFDYRRASLALHGTVCAHCGREFNEKNLYQLTVHHKDSNPNNNPRDGSNWENLCVHCHDDAHSRELLADYLDDEPGQSEPASNSSQPLQTLGEKLKAALKPKNKS